MVYLSSYYVEYIVSECLIMSFGKFSVRFHCVPLYGICLLFFFVSGVTVCVVHVVLLDFIVDFYFSKIINNIGNLLMHVEIRSVAVDVVFVACIIIHRTGKDVTY